MLPIIPEASRAPRFISLACRGETGLCDSDEVNTKRLSCNGDEYTCTGMKKIEVGDRSCNGAGACFNSSNNRTKEIKAAGANNVCNGSRACWNLGADLVLVGGNQCHGFRACSQNYGLLTVGAWSCVSSRTSHSTLGNAVCSENTVDVDIGNDSCHGDSKLLEQWCSGEHW